MNKAFVKEDDSLMDAGPELYPDARADIPAGAKNYMTPKGAQRLRKELDELVREGRPALIEQINRIRAKDAGKSSEKLKAIQKELRKILHRIDFLTQRLQLTEVVDPVKIESDHVQFGATVIVRHEDDSEKAYQIVGIDESDVNRGRISWVSPMARALMDAKAGDALVFKTPAREEELEILEVTYQEVV